MCIRSLQKKKGKKVFWLCGAKDSHVKIIKISIQMDESVLLSGHTLSSGVCLGYKSHREETSLRDSSLSNWPLKADQPHCDWKTVCSKIFCSNQSDTFSCLISTTKNNVGWANATGCTSRTSVVIGSIQSVRWQACLPPRVNAIPTSLYRKMFASHKGLV